MKRLVYSRAKWALSKILFSARTFPLSPTRKGQGLPNDAARRALPAFSLSGPFLSRGF